MIFAGQMTKPTVSKHWRKSWQSYREVPLFQGFEPHDTMQGRPRVDQVDLFTHFDTANNCWVNFAVYYNH